MVGTITTGEKKVNRYEVRTSARAWLLLMLMIITPFVLFFLATSFGKGASVRLAEKSGAYQTAVVATREGVYAVQTETHVAYETQVVELPTMRAIATQTAVFKRGGVAPDKINRGLGDKFIMPAPGELPGLYVQMTQTAIVEVVENWPKY